MNETVPDIKRLNPDIKEVRVGVRRLRTIKVYPLSASDQFELSDIITEAIKTFMASEGEMDIAFVSVMVKLVSENIGKILEFVTDEKDRGDNILKDLTNNQVIEIAEIIYEVNYAALQKKVTSLLMVLGPMPQSPLGRSSQPPSEDILNTNYVIFSGEDTEKEDLPSGKLQ